MVEKSQFIFQKPTVTPIRGACRFGMPVGDVTQLTVDKLPWFN